MEITDELEQMSLKASRAVNGEIVGVDLMNDEGVLNVIEVNGTSQFKGVATVTKVNVAREIVDYILDVYK